jgi:hypothetical protein
MDVNRRPGMSWNEDLASILLSEALRLRLYLLIFLYSAS